MRLLPVVVLAGLTKSSAGRPGDNVSTATAYFTFTRVRCYWRPLIIAAASVVLFGLFWFASRYPQLFSKAEHVGQILPSMAYSSEAVSVATDAHVWLRILAAAVNWLDSMKVGMTFGVLFGALLHIALRDYPLRIGRNLYLNSVKGALVGVPMGVCANCAVPTACGVTRGHGRVEVALGFFVQLAKLQSGRDHDDVHGPASSDECDQVRHSLSRDSGGRAILDPLAGAR
jgi:hypothetical protein